MHFQNEKDGETGVVHAAIRKIDHELGVGHLEKQDMKVQGRFLYKVNSFLFCQIFLEFQALMADSPWGEHELDYALIYRNLDLNRIRINEEEVSDVKAIESDELMEWIHGGIFFIIFSYFSEESSWKVSIFGNEIMFAEEKYTFQEAYRNIMFSKQNDSRTSLILAMVQFILSLGISAEMVD